MVKKGLDEKHFRLMEKKTNHKVDLSKVRLNDIGSVTDWELYALKMAEVLEAAMPAVHEAVRNYEAQLKSKEVKSEGQGKGPEQ